eukprot:jgi/Botrbrau1/6896/Bobra.67_3s0015.1
MSPMEVEVEKPCPMLGFSLGSGHPPTEIIKSPQDKKLYRRVTLQNGMHVLLISDPEMETEHGVGNTSDHAGQGSRPDADMSEESDEESEEDEEEEEDDEEDDTGSSEAGDESDEEVEEGDDEGAGAHRHTHPKGPAVKKAAAAMAVGVGSFCDTDVMPGISHYLEHMLFMGSKQYPDENDYDSYLSKHGGASNAYTELEYTNFHFECKPDALRGALERFAQFFIAPLCKANALEREVMAVENEFLGVIQSDSTRLSQVRCHTARDSHLYRKFSWGNRRSLYDEPLAKGVDIRQQIMEYYKGHYSAERMSLVLLGGESLDTLEAWARELFSAVPAGAGPRPSFSHAGEPYKGATFHIVPGVKQIHEITVSFQLPCLFDHYEAKAEDYISHLIGHEGEGSLLSALKRRGWANTLTAGVGENGYERNSAAFVMEITIGLTEAGLAASPGGGLAVVGLLFDYIALLRREGPQAWVYEEMRATSEMRFRFAEEEDAMDTVTHLACDLHRHPPNHTLLAPFLLSRWDPPLVDRLLEAMTPENARIDLLSSNWEEVKAALSWPALVQGVEPWFNVPFVSAPLPQDILTSWQRPDGPTVTDLSLPRKNPFIPTDFTLRCDTATAIGSELSDQALGSRDRQDDASEPEGLENGENPSAPAFQRVASLSTPPVLLVDERGLRVWHKLDTTFRIPKASAYFRLSSPVAYESPAAAASTDLLVKIWTDALCETAYLADVAGLQYEIWPEGRQGIYIRVEGFSHKLEALISTIFSHLANLKVSAEQLARLKEAQIRKYSNVNMKPDRHATYLRLLALKHCWRVEALLEALTQLSLEDIQAFVPRLLAKTHTEAFLHGNVSAAKAVRLSREVVKTLGSEPLPEEERPCDDIVYIPFGASYLHRAPVKNAEEDNSVTELYFQVGPDSPEARAVLDVMEAALSEPFYDVLRTQEQLGYAVHCGLRLTHAMLGFAFVIVSGTHGPAHLDQRIRAWLAEAEKRLAGMEEAELAAFRTAAISGKLQADRSLFDEAERFWEQIASSRYNFRVREDEAGHLAVVSKERLLDTFRATMVEEKGTARRLAIHVVGRRAAAELAEDPPHGTALLGDLDAMKRGLETFRPPIVPLPAPVLALA